MDFRLRLHHQTFRRIQKSLHSGSAILFGGLMLGNAVAYAYLMLIARMMSPVDYGVLVTLTSVSYVLAVLMRTIQAWMIKAVTTARDVGIEHMRTVFMMAMHVLLPLGFVVFAGHWLVSRWVAEFLHLRTAIPVIVLGLYTFSSFLIPIPRGMLIGLNRLHHASMIHVLEPVVRLAAGVSLVLWGLKVNGALTGYAIGNFIGFTIALVLLWPLLRHRQDQPSSTGGFDGLDRYALLVLVVNTSLMVMASIDQIAVKHYFSGEIAGNYAVAFLLGRIIAMSTISLGWVIFARSAIMPLDDPGRVRLLVKGLLVAGSIAISLTMGYLAVPKLAVQLMGGSQYSIADDYVGLVGIEMTLFALVYVQAYYHISLKKVKVVLPLFVAVVLEIIMIAKYHNTVQQVLLALILVTGVLLICVSGLSWWVLRTREPTAHITVRSSPETVDLT